MEVMKGFAKHMRNEDVLWKSDDAQLGRGKLNTSTCQRFRRQLSDLIRLPLYRSNTIPSHWISRVLRVPAFSKLVESSVFLPMRPLAVV